MTLDETATPPDEAPADDKAPAAAKGRQQKWKDETTAASTICTAMMVTTHGIPNSDRLRIVGMAVAQYLLSSVFPDEAEPEFDGTLIEVEIMGRLQHEIGHAAFLLSLHSKAQRIAAAEARTARKQ